MKDWRLSAARAVGYITSGVVIYGTLFFLWFKDFTWWEVAVAAMICAGWGVVFLAFEAIQWYRGKRPRIG
jgi:hypothetical protein